MQNATKLPGAKGLPQVTEKQQDFIRELIRGRKPEDAARAAGFAEPETQCHRIMREPAVAWAIRIEVARLLTVEAAPLAYRVLVDLARNEAVPPAVRRACARDLLDRAGFVAPKASDAAPDEKPLSEMTSEELRGLIDRLESELGARAVDVSPADNAQSRKPSKANGLKWL